MAHATKQKKESQHMRPPVVVIVGHVDHGKSSILETIRKTKMLEREVGGITQHIGAYEVLHQGKKITFIDTPGHEAFSKMRARGAVIADIAVLVIAADEGVKPQTKEALAIIQQHNVPFIVALNKIDKPEANPERVKQELAQENVLVETYGGKIPSVEVSAKTGAHIDDLLEMILLVAEIENLTCDQEKHAEGTVLETHIDPRRGITTTLLISDGKLIHGDALVIGSSLETVKTATDFLGATVKESGPSSVVVLSALSSAPLVGDIFRAFSSKSDAESYIAALPQKDKKEISVSREEKPTKPIFNLILKADVAGSREVLEESLKKLENDLVGMRIIRSEIGSINESDIKLGMATGQVTIVGFKVRIDTAAKELLKNVAIQIITKDIIYELLDTVKERMADILPPLITRIPLGKARIIKLFKNAGTKQIVGGKVEDGTIKKNVSTDVQRNRETIGNGIILQLRREKLEAKEVAQGFECGIMVDTSIPLREGDVLDVFEEEIKKQTL